MYTKIIDGIIPQRLSEDVLAENWFSFLHQTFSRLKAKMAERKIAQDVIVARLGSDKGSVSRWLSGHSNLTLRTMFKIARALDYVMEIHFVDLTRAQPVNRMYIEQKPIEGSNISGDEKGATPRSSSKFISMHSQLALSDSITANSP